MHALLIVGPSGAGKSTIQDRLIHSDHFMRVTTVTTRPRKPSEFDGYDYTFTTHDTFKEMERDDKFIETTSHSGTLYGIPKSEIELSIKLKKIPIVVVTPHAIQIFIDEFSSSLDVKVVFLTAKKVELIERLQDSKFNSTREDKIKSLDTEMSWMGDYAYDLLMYNNDISETIGKINEMLLSD